MASAGASGKNTVTPSANRLLQRKWDERKYREHQDRLRRIKASVDNGLPRNFVHIKQNVRKKRLEEERQTTIQRHNNELLTRMNHIMHTGGRVDHRNIDWSPKKSLNHVKRQNEMDKISRENQAILRRIQTVRPQYSIRKWEGDFVVHKTRTKALSLFPPIESPPKPVPMATTAGSSGGIELPPIVEKPSRPETQPIPEEIDVEDHND